MSGVKHWECREGGDTSVIIEGVGPLLRSLFLAGDRRGRSDDHLEKMYFGRISILENPKIIHDVCSAFDLNT